LEQADGGKRVAELEEAVAMLLREKRSREQTERNHRS
jgi:hypothetical protein